MGNIFAITTVADDVRADAIGKTSAIFTVTNTSNRPVRGIARARAMGNTEQNWLDVEGDTERDFGAGFTEQFTVNFNSSSGPAGKFPFRLDVASATNPDEHFTEGPTVNVHTAPPAQLVQKGKFPLWIVIVLLVLLVAAAVVLFLVFRTSGGSSNNYQPASTIKANKKAGASNKNNRPPPAVATENDEQLPSAATKSDKRLVPESDLVGTWIRPSSHYEIKWDGNSYIFKSLNDLRPPYRGTITADGVGEFSHTDSEGTTKITVELTGPNKLITHWSITYVDPEPGIPQPQIFDLDFSRE